jgi:hypothetical protein
MWRSEYDGREHWAYSTQIKQPKEKKTIKRLIGDYWPRIEDLHDEEKKGHKWHD